MAATTPIGFHLREEKLPFLTSPDKTRLFQMVFFAAIIFLVDYLSVVEPLTIPGNVAAIWPVTGISIALLIRYGYRVWGAVFVGVLCSSLLTNGLINWPVAVGCAIANTAEGVAALALLRRFVGGSSREKPFRTVAFYVGCVAIVAPALSTLIGVTATVTFYHIPEEQYLFTAATWFLSNVIGALVVTPVLVLWWLGPPMAWTRQKIVEAVLIVLLLIGLAFAVCSIPFQEMLVLGQPVIFLFLPIALWAALSFGQLASALVVLALAIICASGTASAHGPFVLDTVVDSLLYMQTYLAILVSAALLFAAIITERRNYARALSKLNTELEDRVRERTAELVEIAGELQAFAHTVAHDLRTPLYTLLGLSKMLQQEYAGHLGKRGEEFLEHINTVIAEMDALVAESLQNGELPNGTLALSPINLEEALKVCYAQAESVINSSRAMITIELPVKEVVGQRTLLVQVFMNLLTNALKYVAEDTTPVVLIRSENRGAFVRIWVEDNGVGVPADKQKVIFEEFERLHSPGVHEGSGLGLATVQRIVKRLGGRVGVESGDKGGSRFWVEVPSTEPPL